MPLPNMGRRMGLLDGDQLCVCLSSSRHSGPPEKVFSASAAEAVNFQGK